MVASLIPGNWQSFEGTEGDTGLVFQLFHLRFQVEGGEALRQSLEGLLPFHAGQVCSQAVMNARPKGHMGVGIPVDVKLVRLREDLRVSIGRRDKPPDAVIFMDKLAPHFHILGSDALDGLDGGIIA
jgi:hypothetical protein